jgi:hypothetical protein
MHLKKTTKNAVFWTVASCGLVEDNQFFQGHTASIFRVEV